MNAADNTTKEIYYNLFEYSINSILGRDLLSVAGYWNAFTEPSDESMDQILKGLN